MKRLVILNPASKNGSAARIFGQIRRELEKKLGYLDIYVTRGPGDASLLVKKVLKKKEFDQILIAGGDGTVNEAVNGYFERDRIISKTIPLGIINLGTGGDLFRHIQQMSALYDIALKENSFRMVDCGRILSGESDEPRHFINISSIGVAGKILHSLKHSRFQWGAPAYFFHTIRSLILYRAFPVKIRYSESPGKWNEIESEPVNLFICNGQYNGGGMHWAPRGNIEDGVFDIVLISGIGKFSLIRQTPLVYAGRIDDLIGARQFRAREIIASGKTPLIGEMDGEIMSSGNEYRYSYSIVPRRFPLIA